MDTPTDAAAPGNDTDAEPDVKLTDRAATRIARFLLEDYEQVAFRVSVAGGGCSGFQYQFALVPTIEPDDMVIRQHGAVVVVDPVSLPYLKGAELDFVQDIMGDSFQIRNPQATASCGCGTSFSV